MKKIALVFLIVVTFVANASTTYANPVTSNIDLEVENLPISVNAGDKLIVDIGNDPGAGGDVLYQEYLINSDYTNLWGFESTKTDFSVLYNNTSFTFITAGSYSSSKSFAEDYSDAYIDWSVNSNVGTLEFLQDWDVDIDKLYSKNGATWTEKTDFNASLNGLQNFAYYQQVSGEETNADYSDLENGDYFNPDSIDLYLNETDLDDSIRFIYENGYAYLDDLETPIKDLNGVINKLVFTGDLYHYVEIIDPVNNVTYAYDTTDWDVREIIFSVDGSNVLTVTFEEIAGAVDETEYNVSADTYLRLSTVSEDTGSGDTGSGDTGSGDTGSGGVITSDAETFELFGIAWYWYLAAVAVVYFGFTKKGRKVIGLK